MVTKEQIKEEWKVESERLDALFEEFKKEYPNLYKNTERINFDVPRGWLGLVQSLSKILEPLGAKCIQTKQKMGHLRFYIENNILERSGCVDAISTFERASITVCENCGNLGTLNTEENFIQTLCKKCAIIRDNKWKT